MNRPRTNQITLWASIIFLVLVLIAVLVIFLVPTGKPDTNGTTDPTGTKPSPSATATEAAGIGCEAPASDNREVPADLRWEASQGVTWPVSDTVGPTAETDGFADCFEHSPTGAALAAITVLFSQADHSPLESGQFYIADSPGRDAALSNIEAGDASQLIRSIQSNGISVVGFQIEEYDGDRAAVRIVLRVPDSSTGYRGLPYPMVWVDGDWKVKPLDTGSTGQASDVRPDDFTPWTPSNG